MESSGVRTRPYAVLIAAMAVAAGTGILSVRPLESGDARGSTPVTVLIAATLVAALSMLAAALTRRSRAVLPWVLLGLQASVTTGTQAVLLLGDAAQGPYVVAGRSVMVTLGVTALVLFTGVPRSLREWSVLVLDGGLTAGALVTVVWTLMAHQRDLLSVLTERYGAIGWFLVDLVTVCVLLGLIRRTRGRHSAIAVGMLAVIGVATFADLSWAVFGVSPGSAGRATYVGAWIVAVIVAVAVPWLGRDEPFYLPAGIPRRMSSIRLPHVLASVAIACVVVASANGRATDAVDAALVVLLLAGMLISLILLARENRLLYREMVAQADGFRVQATRDSLTGLPNRSEFTRHVRRALDGPGRGRVAVLFIDLDGFKHVNDTFGHEAGDLLLTEAAARLSAQVRGEDVVARFGGDEFVALLADCTDAQARQIAERLRVALARPYSVDGRELVVSASLGLARPTDGDDAESALRNADLALYRAKEQGRDRVAVYQPDMHASSVRRVGGVARLRQAIAQDRLSLQYQPIVELRTGSLHSVEALLRFDESDLPGWSLAEVLRAAEDSGLMVPLGQWVLEAAVGQLGAWRAEGYDVHLSVNLSARQLERDDPVGRVHEQLRRHAVPPDRLTLEITEPELVGDLRRHSAVLAELRASGVRVVLDDFGAGASALRYLPLLPLDGLKIDGGLVAGVGRPRDILPAVLRLGRDLGLVVVAEGIETAEQLVLLREAGCTLGQGYLIGRPQGAVATGDVVRAGRVALPVVELPTTIFVPDVETRVASA